MKIKRLVLLSLGVLGASMPFGAYAVNPIMPMAQQEQLQEDREVQQERNLRLDAERVETVVSESTPIEAYRTKSVCENPYDTSKYLVL